MMDTATLAAPALHQGSANEPPLSRAAFEARLRGHESRYHIHHPFHRLMAEGRLSRAQLQGWVANRFYYQLAIPRKDAAILANCPDREIRREWVQRILDHDGRGDDPGGIEAWIALAEAVGIVREELLSLRRVVPAARFAVDAYVEFARRQPWQEAVASSLTELFAPHIHQQRIDLWPAHYPWVKPEGLAYFRKRLQQARRDVDHGLAFTLDYFGRSRALQERAVDILRFKLDVLWALADAILLDQCEIEIKGAKA